MAALSEQLNRGESEINAARYDLGAAKLQASSYLDLLRTREWRRGPSPTIRLKSAKIANTEAIAAL